MSSLKICRLVNLHKISKQCTFAYSTGLPSQQIKSNLPKILNSIKTLSTTDEWRKSIEIIHENQIKCTRSTLPTFSCLAANAFYESDVTLAWNLLNAIKAANLNPNCIVFHTYWKYCSANRAGFVEGIEKMLEWIGENEILVSGITLEELSMEIKSFHGTMSPTQITYDGICEKCQQELNPARLSELEFRTLKKKFEQIFVKSHIATSELSIFKGLVNSKKRYDFIIDALNVTRIFPESQGNIFKQSKLLADIVEHLKRQKKRVCIIGKKHINEWPEQPLNYVRQNASVFLTKNSSNDDIYMMYAAFVCGAKTDFISNDLFSEYRKLFNPTEQTLFRRWQKQHQNFISYDDRRGFRIHRPKLYESNAHKNDGDRWHVPFVADPIKLNEKNSRISWACINLRK